MAKFNLIEALKEIIGEKNIPMEILVGAIEDALAIAYRKSFDSDEDIKVELNKDTGDFRVISRRVVIDSDDLDEPDKQYTLEEAKELDPEAQPGDIVEEDITPPSTSSFGRIAAQTARQVVSQKLKEAERGLIYEEFNSKIGQIMTGRVHRVERGNVYIDFARADAVLPSREQIPGEAFRPGDHVKCYIQEVKATPKGPQIVLSRASAKFVEMLFRQAVPEIEDGVVNIESSSREAGLRVKISVSTTDNKIDPVGACVGLRGSRIKGIVDELNGEKIDIVRYNDDAVDYVSNALSPAKVLSVEVSEDRRSALAIVSQSQLSLAIGKEGQNVKLASKLTGIKIDIKTEKDVENMNSSDGTKED
jgi:N utilization substance protein A